MDTEEPYGWAVELTTPFDGDGGEALKRTYYAAIEDEAEAEKAVLKAAGAAAGETVTAKLRIRLEVVKGLGIKLGEVRRWA